MELFVPLQSLFFFFLLPLFIFFAFHTASRRRNSPETAGFKSYPIVGSLPGFVRNRHRFLEWTTEVLTRCPTHTAVFRQPGNLNGVMTANPANVEYITKTKFDNFPRGERFTSHLEDMLGSGIFNSDGEMWRIQRKTASYEFNTRSLRHFVIHSVAVEITTRLIPMLAEAARAGEVLDLQDVLGRFAFDNICKLAFNVDPGALGGRATSGDELIHAFDEAATLSLERFMYINPNVWKLKRKLNLGSERLLRESIEVVHRFADEIIRSKMEGESWSKDEDLLSRFIGVDEMNSPESLRNNVINFMLAGRDTTSAALSWFFWLLSSHPDVEQKIVRELEWIRARTGKRIGETYSFEDLKEMNYLHASITESLRLYPPVPMDTKTCLEDDVLPDGTFVGKGWFVTYEAYAMGRMESLWGKDCERYYPERWIENGTFKPETPFKFPVFHAGPRICMGKEMAYIQMKSIAAAVLERFEIRVADKNDRPQYLLSMTLRIKGGLHVNVKQRNE